MSTNEEFAVFECVDPLRGVAVSVEGLHPVTLAFMTAL